MSNHNAIYRYAEQVGLSREEAVKKAIREGGGVPEGAAIIGIHRASLYNFVQKYKIAVEVTRKRVIGNPSKSGAR